MRRTVCTIRAVLVLVIASNSAEITSAAETPSSEVVTAFLQKHCFECHSGSDAEDGVNLHEVSLEITSEERANLWGQVIDQVKSDLMPPLDMERPDATECSDFIRTVEPLLLKSEYGQFYRRKLLLPEFGNYVDHDLLFSGDITMPAFSPARLWRRSPQAYTKQPLGKRAGEQTPYVYSTSEAEFRDYSALSSVDYSTIELIIVAVNEMLEEELFSVRGGKKPAINFQRTEKFITIKPHPNHRYAPFTRTEPAGPGDLARLINDEFLRIHARPPKPEDTKRYQTLYQKCRKEADQIGAMKAVVTAIALAPESIFRMEFGLGKTDEHGRRRLSDVELAFSLAYALTDTNPYRHQSIAASLKKGELKTDDGLNTLVDQLLKLDSNPIPSEPTESVAMIKKSYTQNNPRVLRFFQEFFAYTTANKVFKDDQRLQQELDLRFAKKNFIRPMIVELDTQILQVLANDQDVLHELLTGDDVFIGHTGDRADVQRKIDTFVKGQTEGKRFAKTVADTLERGLTPFPGPPVSFVHVNLYELPHAKTPNGKQLWDFPLEQPLQMPHRFGVLTHPVWLWAHSTNFDTDPIHRGIWVFRKLLAGVMPDVPPEVDAKVPEDTHKTLRERMDVVRPDACWKCHRKINPLGETFEVFDDFGRFREGHYFDKDGTIVARRDSVFVKKKVGKQLTARPVDSTGELRGTGDERLDGPVADAFELIEKISRSDRARQSFVRHTFRYFMGRNELLSDSQTLIAADQAYVESGGSFRALLKSLLTSDSFVYRK